MVVFLLYLWYESLTSLTETLAQAQSGTTVNSAGLESVTGSKKVVPHRLLPQTGIDHCIKNKDFPW